MSFAMIMPLLRGSDWWDVYDYPAQIFDQRFGLPLLDSDLLDRIKLRGNWIYPRTQANIAASGKSEVKIDDKEFIVDLNVNQFKPEELQVKVVDNFIVIHGKHEERSDDHGFISREFTRRYMLPKSCDKDNVAASLNSEGMLTITAPKKAIEPAPKQVREVPIEQEAKEAVKEIEESKEVS